jgi:hypothetical protein
MGSAPVRLGAPKDSMEGRKLLPNGRYTVQLDGFAQKMSKKGDSINYNPKLRIINHPKLAGEKVYTSLNQGAGFILLDFCHMLGHQMEQVGDDFVFPGGFIPNPADPNDVSKMTYQGPLQGSVGDVLVDTNQYEGKPQNYIKQYFCKIPGCTQKHATELK